MRRLVAIGTAVLAGTGPLAGAAGPASIASGRLAGETQISFGCPGPVREGVPSCHPWHAFAHARFSVAALPANGTSRVVVSDAHGRFALRLPAGRYTVTPLAQAQTRGGPRLQVRVRAGMTTAILVRFQGFPQMA